MVLVMCHSVRQTVSQCFCKVQAADSDAFRAQQSVRRTRLSEWSKSQFASTVCIVYYIYTHTYTDTGYLDRGPIGVGRSIGLSVYQFISLSSIGYRLYTA